MLNKIHELKAPSSWSGRGRYLYYTISITVSLLKAICWRAFFVLYDLFYRRDPVLLNKKVKASEKNTAFILGSGKSLQSLTEKEIALIHKGFVIGSGRLIYDGRITPDLYITECASSFRETSRFYAEFFGPQVCFRINDLKNTLFLVKISYFSFKKIRKIEMTFPAEVRSNIIFFNQFLSPIGSAEAFSCFLRFIFRFSIIFRLRQFPACRSNNVLATILAVRYHFSSIFLLGNDGYTGYFYDAEGKGDCFKAKQVELQFIGNKNSSGELHSTYDPKFGLPTVQQCMEEISKFCYDSSESRIFCSRSSIISKRLPAQQTFDNLEDVIY